MLTAEDRALMAALAQERAGLRIEADKAYLVESRLAPVARREGFGSLAEFAEAVRAGHDERLVWAAVEALASSETSFFRDPEVFSGLTEALRGQVLAHPDRPVRVWSAACASGQEVYSLAMMLEEDAALGARVELFASDLSERSLEKAQAGLYSQFEAQRGLPARRLVRHFENRGELFALSPRLRQMVRWRRVNLLDDPGRLGAFDIILCRYVLMGMTRRAAGRVLSNLVGALAPGGRLVLGKGEAVPGWLQPTGPDRCIYALAAEGVRSAA